MKPIKYSLLALSLSALVVLAGCNAENHRDTTPEWCAKVNAHMTANDAGTKVWTAIEAHGGLEKWLDAGVLDFRWTYNMRDKGSNAVVDTVQQVDPNTLRATHQVQGRDIRFGWTGESAWVHPPEAEFMPPPRFWALTPFYFVGIPFVFADVNAKFEELPTIEFEGTSYEQVKITYKAGSGDAPDDYYILLIDPASHQIAGARYIVTSKLVAKDGPGPEKLITLEKYTDVGGLTLPTFHRTFKMDGDTIGEIMRDATASEYKWRSEEEVDFSVPAGAKAL